jgi:mRNA interferase RelE/StbE
MVAYNIRFKRSAEKELKKLPPVDLRKIIHRIGALSKDPTPAKAQMLKGDNRYYRVRQGNYRVIYEVDDVAGEIIIIKIGHRSDVYR